MIAGKRCRLRLESAYPLPEQLHIAQKKPRQRGLRYARDSYFPVLANIGQRLQAVPFEDLRELIEQRAVHLTIRSQSFLAVQLKGAAVKIRHFATRLFDDQHARSRVPGIEVELPESVEASAGHAAQVQSRRT